MLKKVVGLLMGILLLMVSVSFAEETLASIQSMTELGEIQKKLDQGITIGKVYYTDGYGFSTSEFTTDDPDEIAQLWNLFSALLTEHVAVSVLKQSGCASAGWRITRLAMRKDFGA